MFERERTVRSARSFGERVPKERKKRPGDKDEQRRRVGTSERERERGVLGSIVVAFPFLINYRTRLSRSICISHRTTPISKESFVKNGIFFSESCAQVAS